MQFPDFREYSRSKEELKSALIQEAKKNMYKHTQKVILITMRVGKANFMIILN